MSRINDSAVTSEEDYHAHLEVAEPGGVDQVPYSYTCDAGNCDNETIMIIKTVRRPPEAVGNDVSTFWLSVCRQHSKDEMNYAGLMLGRLYVVILRPDLVTTETVELP